MNRQTGYGSSGGWPLDSGAWILEVPHTLIWKLALGFWRPRARLSGCWPLDSGCPAHARLEAERPLPPRPPRVDLGQCQRGGVAALLSLQGGALLEERQPPQPPLLGHLCRARRQRRLFSALVVVLCHLQTPVLRSP